MPEGPCRNTLKREPSKPSMAPWGPNLWPFIIFMGQDKKQRESSPRSLFGLHLKFPAGPVSMPNCHCPLRCPLSP